jgi:hypothetical protein
MTDRRCLVAICHNMPFVYAEAWQSCMELGWGSRVADACAAHGFAGIDFLIERGYPRVDAMRNAVVWKMRHKTPGRYSHLLSLDADMVFPTDVLRRMLAHHDQGIVSGHYCLKGGANQPVAMRNPHVPAGATVTHYEYDAGHRDDPAGTDARGLRDVDVVGMGCTLIPMAVFDAIGDLPWFEYENGPDGMPIVSEDVPFCRKARAAGVRVCWDPSIKCGHAATKVVTPTWTEMQQDGLVPTMLNAFAKVARVETVTREAAEAAA